jgi:hypothetical protein
MAIKPLQGVRMLDLMTVLAGSFACHQLAHQRSSRSGSANLVLLRCAMPAPSLAASFLNTCAEHRS